jgi:hypothetical protein
MSNETTKAVIQVDQQTDNPKRLTCLHYSVGQRALS